MNLNYILGECIYSQLLCMLLSVYFLVLLSNTSCYSKRLQFRSLVCLLDQ